MNKGECYTDRRQLLLIQRLRQLIRSSKVGKRGDRDDQWQVVVGSASLLNSSLTLGTPVVWFAETSNDKPLGMPIS